MPPSACSAATFSTAVAWGALMMASKSSMHTAAETACRGRCYESGSNFGVDFDATIEGDLRV